MVKKSNQPFYYPGDQRGLILFHSFSSNPVDMVGIGRSLAKDGYTVYGPLLTHHGGALEECLIDPKIWLEDGRQAVEYLMGKGCQSIACFGLSLGGIISHQMIMEFDEVLGGGSISSPMIAGYATNTPEDFWQRYVIQKEDLAWPQEKILASRVKINQGVQTVLEGLDEIKESMYPHFAEVKKPIFIAQGGADQIIDPSQAYELKDLYFNSPLDFHWYDDGVHLLTVGKYRKPLYQAIKHFLETYIWPD